MNEFCIENLIYVIRQSISEYKRLNVNNASNLLESISFFPGIYLEFVEILW